MHRFSNTLCRFQQMQDDPLYVGTRDSAEVPYTFVCGTQMKRYPVLCVRGTLHPILCTQYVRSMRCSNEKVPCTLYVHGTLHSVLCTLYVRSMQCTNEKVPCSRDDRGTQTKLGLDLGSLRVHQFVVSVTRQEMIK